MFDLISGASEVILVTSRTLFRFRYKVVCEMALSVLMQNMYCCLFTFAANILCAYMSHCVNRLIGYSQHFIKY